MAYLNVSESSLKFEIIINKSNSRAYSYWLGINAAYLSNLEKTRNFETGTNNMFKLDLDPHQILSIRTFSWLKTIIFPCQKLQ